MALRTVSESKCYIPYVTYVNSGMQCVPLPTNLMKSTQLPTVKDRQNPQNKGRTNIIRGRAFL